LQNLKDDKALAPREVQEGDVLPDVVPRPRAEMLLDEERDLYGRPRHERGNHLSHLGDREYVLGFGRTAIEAGMSANISAIPQIIFRPERLIIPSNIAIHFQVSDIKIGKNSQLSLATTTSSVPAVIFAETSSCIKLRMDTCLIDMNATLSVTNVDTRRREFTAALIGPAIE
jgi:hypothetical protein